MRLLYRKLPGPKGLGRAKIRAYFVFLGNSQWGAGESTKIPPSGPMAQGLPETRKFSSPVDCETHRAPLVTNNLSSLQS